MLDSLKSVFNLSLSKKLSSSASDAGFRGE